jgi:antitoxin MazE
MPSKPKKDVAWRSGICQEYLNDSRIKPMTQAILGRWGKNLAVRLPNEIANQFSLREGERVEIEAGHGQIVIRLARPCYSLDALFAGKSAGQWRSLYADAYDWGPDVGQEIVEE